jgi:hypothetical protein
MYAETKNLIEKAMTNQEQIDKYLAGQMTEDEKLQFERLLSAEDSSLRDEMELQKEIILAIRRRSLKEMLQGEEESIQKEKEEHHQRIKRIKIWSLGGSTLMAMAAVLLFLFVLAPVAQQMQDYSNQYISSIEVNVTRGDVDQVQSLDDAILLMQNDHWREAEQIIDGIYRKTELDKENQQETYYKAEWFKAICLMHEGKALQAKRLLRRIVNSDSAYSNQAKDALNAL